MVATSIHSLADPAMLSKIDKLFTCNVGHYIDLPQIVVVGDQSSGKSSVLEGLTRLPFPRDSGLCTRFATQITFRRAVTKSISVSAIPGKDASPDHVDALRAWRKTDMESLGKEEFAKIMREVQEIMGITLRDGAEAGPLKTFSSDVLSIEVAGPDEEHLTVIDVPGIFQRVTKDVTTKEDKEFVRNMVQGYMKNPRSIMLTVIPSNVDVATQLILEMAEEEDKEGQRTLGVLTKPDLVDKGAESSVMDMIEGRSHQLLLGWCLVRNPGQKDVEDLEFDRHIAEEQFFNRTIPWNRMPKDRVGVAALRVRLQEVLARHIRREFPKVNKKLKECKKALEALGPKRDTPIEQSRFLIDMATRFQTIVTKALDAKYVDDCFSEHPRLKIATSIIHRDEMLARAFEKYGHTYQFKNSWWGKDEDFDVKNEDESTYHDDILGHVWSNWGKGISGRVRDQPLKCEEQGEVGKDTRPPLCFCTRQSDEPEDLADILHPIKRIPKPKAVGIMDWITTIYSQSRGFELGQFDPSLLATVFKAQTESWDDLAFGYISDVVVTTHAFIETLLEHVCPERSIRQNIKSITMDGLVERYQKAINQVEFILGVERFGVPATQNHYFNENLQKCRQERDRKSAAEKSFYISSHKEQVVKLSDITQTRTMSNKEHTVQDIHDILKSYYKVARKRIVDNLCMQAASYHLVSGPDTPAKLFSPAFVSQLSDEQLEGIAGEDALVRRRRALLAKEIDDLERGKKILS